MNACKFPSYLRITRKLLKLPKSTVPVNKNCQYNQYNVTVLIKTDKLTLAIYLLKINKTSQNKNEIE